MTKTSFSLAVALIVGSMAALPLSAKTDTAGVLNSVDQVSKALANDDLGAAKIAAGDLAQSAKGAGKQTLAQHASELAKSDSLESAREHLKMMSGDAAALAKGSSQYHVMDCPMAGAKWVQSGDKVMNPYMGKAMQQCGSKVNSKGAGTGGIACCPMG